MCTLIMHVLPFWNRRVIILGNVLIVFYCLQGALARVLESIKASSRTARGISLFREFQAYVKTAHPEVARRRGLKCRKSGTGYGRSPDPWANFTPAYYSLPTRTIMRAQKSFQKLKTFNLCILSKAYRYITSLILLTK